MTTTEWSTWAAQVVRRTPGKAAKTAAVRLVDADPRLRAQGDALIAALDAAERCRECGRRIKDPVSVARGIGSECIKAVVA